MDPLTRSVISNNPVVCPSAARSIRCREVVGKSATILNSIRGRKPMLAAAAICRYRGAVLRLKDKQIGTSAIRH